MPGTKNSTPRLAKPAPAQPPLVEAPVQEAIGFEFAPGTQKFSTQSNQTKAPQITPSNILSLQRTIGNQAVQRLIQKQKTAFTSGSAAPVSLSKQREAVGESLALTMPAQVEYKGINSLSGKLGNNIQRLPLVEEIQNRGNSNSKSASSPTYTIVFSRLKQYDSLLEELVQNSEAERQVAATRLIKNLDDMITYIDTYTKAHFKSKSKNKNVESFRQLKLEIDVEKADIQRVVKSDNFNPRTKGAFSRIPWINGKWRTAIGALQAPRGEDLGFKQQIEEGGKEKQDKVNKIVKKLGLPHSYLMTLNLRQVELILQADKALGAGELGEADKALVDLKEALPASFSLIRSTLMRQHVGKLNPELAKAINNPDFKQKDKGMASIGHTETGGKDFIKHFNNFTTAFVKQQDTDSIDIHPKQAKQLTKEYGVSLPKFVSNLKARNDWEKKNVDIKKYESLKDHEKSSIANYSGNYSMSNNPLRGNIQPGEAKDHKFDEESGKPDANNKFTKESLAITQNLISALNKLPPYKGMAYRHDSNFPGFKELNRVGATVSDMAFLSSTREANSLKKILGSGLPEILTVIQSKTGRFIKPGSNFNNLAQGDENEVLFKPGTKFTVTKRVDAHLVSEQGSDRKVWPVGMDSELKNALDQDGEKAQVKIIVKKQEI